MAEVKAIVFYHTGDNVKQFAQICLSGFYVFRSYFFLARELERALVAICGCLLVSLARKVKTLKALPFTFQKSDEQLILQKYEQNSNQKKQLNCQDWSIVFGLFVGSSLIFK